MVSRAAQESISRTEMHTLEAIEGSEYVTLTQIADKLGITKATASVTVITSYSIHYTKLYDIQKYSQ